MSYITLLLGRLVVGLGVGIASMIIPVYISKCITNEHEFYISKLNIFSCKKGEVAPKSFRGQLATLNTLVITFGQVIAYVVNIIYAQKPGGWRYMFGIGAIPAIIQLMIMPFMPESPRRMVAMNDLAKAKQTLQKIYGSTVSDRFIDREIETIQEDMLQSNLGTYKDFLLRQNLKPLLIGKLCTELYQNCLIYNLYYSLYSMYVTSSPTIIRIQHSHVLCSYHSSNGRLSRSSKLYSGSSHCSSN